jgi:phosphatidylserine/phosphatidylglycerophosphate/cardiolipin synthase-like enzyme
MGGVLGMDTVRISGMVLVIGLAMRGAAAGDLVTCFTPGQNCIAFITNEIDGATSELLVQAYSLTSVPIIQAIARAKERRVTVGVILDRVNEQKRYTAATCLANHCIAPLIDDRVTIAHNKVMVINGRDVITGSFNFTAAAQQRNAENVLLIKDEATLAAAYVANWQRRAAGARPLRDFRASQPPDEARCGDQP